MKEIILLLVLICAGQLYGMEARYIGDLPQELQEKIVAAALVQSNTLDETIKVIGRLSALYRTRYNLKGFTQLAHTLADRFNTTTFEVARNFNTDVSDQYLKLGQQGYEYVSRGQINKLAERIKNGLDINYTFDFGNKNVTLLILATQLSNDAAVELLLNAGADSQIKTTTGKTALDFARQIARKISDSSDAQKKKRIVKLLEDAAKAQQNQ